MSTQTDTRKAIQLCLLAGANYFLFYGLGVFLARVLGVKGFGHYNVGVATLILLATVATLGLEKFSLRVFPSYIEKGDWQHAQGFARFSLVTICSVSVAAAIAFLALNWWKHEGLLTPPWVFVPLFIIVVSSMALFMFLVEMLSAAGNAVLATLIYRLLLPLSTVSIIAATYFLGDGMTARKAVICYGIAWVLSLVVILRLGRGILPAEIWKAGLSYKPRRWLQRSTPFFLQSFMMTQFTSSGVIVLELLRSGESEIGIYAASMQVAGFAVLLATATNRLYAPKAALLLDRRDWEGMIRLKQERHAWINPVLLFFLGMVLLFGRRIMGLYGPEFERGYPVLCILSVGVAVSVRHAMASLVLQFFGEARWVLGAIFITGALNIALLVILGRLFGAMGAAIAYSVSLSAMSLSIYFKALSWVRNQQTKVPQRAP